MPKVTKIVVTGANVFQALEGLNKVVAAEMLANPLLAVVGGVQLVTAETAELKVLNAAQKAIRTPIGGWRR